MNTIQEDAVNHFILDYLPPSTNNISISKSKCITQLKRRIIRVDALQKHCLTLNHHLSDKSKELEDTLKKLDSTQDDYKQTSLEFKETLENVSKFEMENQKLKATVATLEQEHLHAITQLAANQSHIVQLEQLVIQKDRKIESLEKYDPKNMEKIIEERISAELKEKLLWKKRYVRLRKKMKDNESKQKIINVLQKYENHSTENTSDCQSLDGHSDNEDNNSVEYMSQLIEQELSQNTPGTMKTTPISLKDRIELDNDYSNEIVSIDTGCGSSLASSDNEKWLNSPDYIFSPIHADNTESYRGRKLITVGTSPILLKNVKDIATSPILSVTLNDVETSPIKLMKKTDVATSPIHAKFDSDICKSMITMTTPSNNNLTEKSKNLILENIVDIDMQASVNTKKTNAAQLDTLNSINDVDSKTSKTEETGIKLGLANLTNVDMQMSPTAIKHSINEKNIYKDMTSPDSDEEQETTSITEESYTNVIEKPSITDIQESASDAKDVEHDTSITLEENITLIQENKNISIEDIHESPGGTKDIERDTPITLERNTQFQENKNLSITDIQESAGDIKDIEQNIPVTLEANITQCQMNKNLSITDIQESAGDTKDIAQRTEAQEKELLNINNSNRVNIDNDMDTEIEMILDSMRFNRKLITPLPRTPVKTNCQPANKHSCDIVVEELMHTTCQEAAIAKDLAGAAREEAASAREYVAKLREDHIKLMADFNKLQKDMINIKSMFKCQQTLRDNADLQENDTVSTPSKNFRSGYLQDKSLVRHSKFNSDKSKDQCSELGDNLNLCDQLQEPATIVRDSLNANQLQTSSSTSRKKQRLNESQDRTKAPGNNGAEIFANDINLDVLDPTKHQQDNKIKIISDNIIKPAEIEHLKSKQDWQNFIQNSQIGTVQQCNIEEDKALTLERKCYNNSEEQDKSPGQDNKRKKTNNAKKLSNLVKYRKKCEKPLFKIKRETPPLAKSCTKRKQLRVCLKKITDCDNSATLNDKDIYANAVKIMTELKAKNSKCSLKTITDVETESGMEKDKDITINSSEKSSNTEISHVTPKDSDNNLPNSIETTCSKSAIACSSSLTKSTIITRSRKMSDRCNNNTLEVANKLATEVNKNLVVNVSQSSVRNNNRTHQTVSDTPLAGRKRKLSDCSADTPSKRVLRNTQSINADVNKIENENDKRELVMSANKNPKESILCVMIQKYGMHSMRYKSRNTEDEDSKTVCEYIEKFMSDSLQLACKQKRDKLIDDMQQYSYKNFIGGLMQYLNNPERKCDLFSKMAGAPAQIQITKSEAVLMYVIKQLRKYWSSVDLVEAILSNIEYILFRLNQTPTFDVVESMSHFYAVLCRLSDDRDRLITFMLDSMYCILFKSVVLIKQCLEAWPNIIPLAHMSKAKTPLMTCFVYLLHFFKCEDKFNRLPEIRNILYRRYFYEIKDWNEMKIVDLLKCSIKELRDNEHDKKMLRIAMIVFGKRHGPKWTNNNIIKKILQPFIENQNISNYIKVFCIALIGPLFKPYPVEMKVHCDIALDQLVSILNTTKSKQIAEAALSSIVLMGRHNYQRVTEVLFSVKMETIDPYLEELIRDHVRSRTVNTWLRTLPKISHDCNKAINM